MPQQGKNQQKTADQLPGAPAHRLGGEQAQQALQTQILESGKTSTYGDRRDVQRAYTQSEQDLSKNIDKDLDLNSRPPREKHNNLME